jgi:uncharacterized RDD family membrane protein YckC
MESSELEYAGFWLRLWAGVIDTVLILVVTGPILTLYYGEAYWVSDQIIEGPFDFFLSWLFPAVVVILFWVFKNATPGKMAIGAKVVDGKTGESATVGQLIGRYFAYFLSIIPLLLGCFWIAFDPRKQGLHDKLAGTVVVRKKRFRN